MITVSARQQYTLVIPKIPFNPIDRRLERPSDAPTGVAAPPGYLLPQAAGREGEGPRKVCWWGFYDRCRQVPSTFEFCRSIRRIGKFCPQGLLTVAFGILKTRLPLCSRNLTFLSGYTEGAKIIFHISFSLKYTCDYMTLVTNTVGKLPST